MTAGASGTSPELLSKVCAAPTDITPGRVDPGIGTPRSWAPVAAMTQRARTISATPPRTIPISKGASTSALRATHAISHTEVHGR